jgi:hypothetical protein
MTAKRARKVPKVKRVRTAKPAVSVSLNGACALRQLSTAVVCGVFFDDTAPEGTHRFLYRLCGIVAKVHASSTRLGPALRLVGEFVASREAKWFTSRTALVPDAIANAVLAQFREHPRRSTRDRVRVCILYDVWSVRRPDTVLGYELVADGSAWVPEPMIELLRLAAQKPLNPHSV